MMSIEKLVSEIRGGKEIAIHKAGVGKVRENCVYVEEKNQIPAFLLEDGAVEANPDGSVTLYAVEGPAVRNLPIYICFEQVSADNQGKVPGNYGAWPKDNGHDTLKVVDGKCYNLPATVTAALITEVVPDWVINAGFPVERQGDSYALTRTDWGGEIRLGRIGKGMWVRYGEGDVNILDLAERSAAEYILTEDGKDVGVLTELLVDLI